MKNDFKQLVSIIVPVYNVEHYLKQCIDSVLSQTLKDIEVILVDDGSTDESGKICDEYALIDNRIQVVHHRVNKGLSCARNDGIDLSTSPFIMFVDGDDSVDPMFCETPYRTAKENNADLVLFGYKRLFTNGKEELISTGFKPGRIDEAQALAFNVMIWDSVWIGLYQKRLFNTVRYPVGKLYEDTGTTHRLIHSAQRIFVVNECLYHYRVGRTGSITTDPITRIHPDRIEMRIRRINDLCNWGEYDGLAVRDALVLLEVFGRGFEEYEFVNNLLKSKKISDIKYLKWKQKALLIAYKLSPMLFDRICIMTGRRARK